MKIIYYFIFLLLLVFSACTEQATSPENGSSIRIEFVDSEDSPLPRLYAPNGPLQKRSLPKTLDLESIDEVRVMILDFSSFDSSSQYFESQDYEDYVEARDNWEGNLNKWGDWQKLLGDYFRVVADQNLDIDGHHAKGVVAGVIGLNYVFVMMMENGARYSVAEGEVIAKEGETVTVRMSGYYWDW